MSELDALVDERLRELGRRTARWMSSDEGRAEMARRAREARRQAYVDLGDAAIEARMRRLAGASTLARALGSLDPKRT